MRLTPGVYGHTVLDTTFVSSELQYIPRVIMQGWSFVKFMIHHPCQ